MEDSASDLKGSSGQEETKVSATKSTEGTPKYYPHIHYFGKTKRWGAWVRTRYLRFYQFNLDINHESLKTSIHMCAKNKKRVYLGTHDSQHLAARCQDRANLKLKNLKHKATLNFCERDYDEDNEMREKLSDEDFVKFLRGESRGSYKRMDKSLCLQKFMAQESSGFKESSSQGGQNNSCDTAVVAPPTDRILSLSQDVLINPAESCTTIGQDVQTITMETPTKLRVFLPPPFTGIPKRPRTKMIRTPKVAWSGTVVWAPVSDSTLLHNTGPSTGVHTEKRSAGTAFVSLERIPAKDKSTPAQPLVQATLDKSTCSAAESDKFKAPAAHPRPVATADSSTTKSNARHVSFSDSPEDEEPNPASLRAKLRLKRKGVQPSPDLSKRCGAGPANIPTLRSAEKKPVHTFKYLNAFKAKGYSLDVLTALALASIDDD